MKKNILFLLGFIVSVQCVFSQDLATLSRQRILLPNGWGLTPVGKSLQLGDLPLNIARSASGKWAAVTNNGQSTQMIQLINTVSDKVSDSIIIPKSWGGLVFSDDEKSLYASGGNDNWVLQYAIRNGKLATVDTFKLGNPWPVKISVAGIAVDNAHQLLYAVTQKDSSLYVVDMRAHRILQKSALGAEAYTCVLSKDRSRLYISVWGGKKIVVYDCSNRKPVKTITVGDHPNDICLSRDEKWLYVANANDNTVSVMDLRKGQAVETLNAALYPGSLTGSTTNSVAVSKDDKTLYVANADNNCLAVFDISRPGSAVSKGFIPTGWYPTCVRVINGKIYIANGKGFSSLPNPNGPNPAGKSQTVVLHGGDPNHSQKVQYIGGGLLMGTMSIIPEPTPKQLAVYAQAVYQNTPYHKNRELITDSVNAGNPIPAKVGQPSPIKHVFYIIKENRTYDQVLGDVKEGNGDERLVLFGDSITPNQHALAKEFVLLDNFYVNGEVSSDGHNWSMGAYATDYLEKNWPTSYGGRGGTEISSGMHPLSNSKAGYIWDQAKKYGVSYRTYGEFANRDKAYPYVPVLKAHACPYFDGMNMTIRDTLRERAWEREFDSLVAADALPQLMTVRFGNDHTEGTKAGRPTPFAHVADNDLAVGLFVHHLSTSKVWNQTVVFILEDDAQNGPDHVDAHRSPAYVAGGLVKRRLVDHTLYTTASVLRTIELITGMPPMTQYDAAAEPMWRCFANQPNNTVFETRPARVNLNELNPAHTKLALLSQHLDFSKEDLVPDQLMNEITWKAVKGENAVMPSPVRAAFLKPIKKEKDDD
ncbi:MAG: bifunctional YncE family protein/alkaline phosphatase family protein [Niabella sp.]|nr:bifunctional YncE family protein/alkaline phosphatase family protein [Niabella sp.]